MWARLLTEVTAKKKTETFEITDTYIQMLRGANARRLAFLETFQSSTVRENIINRKKNSLSLLNSETIEASIFLRPIGNKEDMGWFDIIRSPAISLTGFSECQNAFKEKKYGKGVLLGVFIPFKTLLIPLKLIEVGLLAIEIGSIKLGGPSEADRHIRNSYYFNNTGPIGKGIEQVFLASQRLLGGIAGIAHLVLRSIISPANTYYAMNSTLHVIFPKKSPEAIAFAEPDKAKSTHGRLTQSLKSYPPTQKKSGDSIMSNNPSLLDPLISNETSQNENSPPRDEPPSPASCPPRSRKH